MSTDRGPREISPFHLIPPGGEVWDGENEENLAFVDFGPHPIDASRPDPKAYTAAVPAVSSNDDGQMTLPYPPNSEDNASSGNPEKPVQGPVTKDNTPPSQPDPASQEPEKQASTTARSRGNSGPTA